ncbi:MAG: tetratricopeptide repeat protein [Flavitalea sp.]
MNGLYLRIVFIGIVLTCGYSCKPKNNPGGTRDYSQVLASPLFSGITDSINRFPDKPELYLRRAVLLSQNNLYPIATPDFKKTWELTSDPGVALEYVSNLLLSNNLKDAIKLLKDCQKQFPSSTEFSRRLGEVYLQKGQPQQALEQYNSILSKDSFNFEAWYDKASVLMKQHDTSQAIIAYERSFYLMPINYSGMALASIYVARKNPRALQICNTLLARDTSSVQTEPVFMKGMYYSDTKQYDDAIRAFDTCILRDWKMTDAYIEKGIVLFERNKYAEAMKVFNLAATVSNTDADAYYWMGRCYEKTGDKEQAASNYERAYSLDHSFSDASEALRRLNR